MFVPRIIQLVFFFPNGHQLITFSDKTNAEVQSKDQSSNNYTSGDIIPKNSRTYCHNNRSNYGGLEKTTNMARSTAAEDRWRLHVRSD